MKDFLDEQFLLNNKTAQMLYKKYAESMPIIDYHCHLSVKDIAENRSFDNLYQAWLEGDHYKWRAMRTNGISEEYITGGASDKEKFLKWAETVPKTLRNPLYHWTHLELQRYFGIKELLSEKNAEAIYDRCSALLKTPEYSVRSLLCKMKVVALCTTDDPIDDLHYHDQIAKEDFSVKVLPAFRPDNAMKIENPLIFVHYIEELSKASGINISDYSSLIEALKNRHEFFHQKGCRISDHGFQSFYAVSSNPVELNNIVKSVLHGQVASKTDQEKLQMALLEEFGKMDAQKGWTWQLHYGAIRNNNRRLYRSYGADAGCDSIYDESTAAGLSMLLGNLDEKEELPRTIIYNLNPADNALVASMVGNFQDGIIPGKIQFGSGWWFLDQKNGITEQLNALSSLGLLSHFIGMLTDSRSFLSFPRHEYFRRILCNLIGEDVEAGEIPMDEELLGSMVQGICFNNAKAYLNLGI